MKRPATTWIVFGTCLAVALGAMVWITAEVVRMDRSEARLLQKAAFEEDVRLALWRMDSALATLIGRENARPPEEYKAFYPNDTAYTNMLNEIVPGQILLPSPLLTEESPEVLLNFQYDTDGNLFSPQAPTGNMRDLAEGRAYRANEKIVEANNRLNEFQSTIKYKDIDENLSNGTLQQTQIAQARPQSRSQQRQLPEVQKEVNRQEQASRKQYVDQAVANIAPNPFELQAHAQSDDIIKPMWIGSELVLARKVADGKQEYIQGVWLNWPTIKRGLLERIEDLFPEADLAPVQPGDDVNENRTLTAIPALLLPGEMPATLAAVSSPTVVMLVAAWLALGLAALAVAGLLKGALSLSERRGAFVSAVTHELRTPLTSFRMYTEMLSEGMIPDEEKKQQYLSTLHREADRLGHLVENVLAYARLDGTHPGDRLETVRVDSLIDRIKERTIERALKGGMEFVVDAPDDVLAESVRVDPSAVEQILFNLVDNACKYAATAPDKTIRLDAKRKDGAVVLRISDHGPGIQCDTRRLFRPFSKSARDAAHSAPGLGLGLALSRRLARSMRGDLSLDATSDKGACFVLTLPAA